MVLEQLQPYFESKGWAPFQFQLDTWQAYYEGKSGLIHAPTGHGKTLAAWLGVVSEAMENGVKKSDGCHILWITPMRALAQDTVISLQEPLKALNSPLEVIARTGDTSAYKKAQLRKKLPFCLVTTPETLSLMLTYDNFREQLKNLKAVVVDEWHELLSSKRGVQTELCISRLKVWHSKLRIWGLSATLGNLEEARHILTGSHFKNSVEISADLGKEIHLHTLIPDEIERFPWSGHLGTRLVKRVVSQIEKVQTTLLFTNTRSQAEIWFQEILAQKPEWKDQLALHHGSLEKEERLHVESRLKLEADELEPNQDPLRCVVCTSSLDLGVDFTPVEQVIQVGSPKGVARLLQRAGRSNHQPMMPSHLYCVPTNALELVEFSAARDSIQKRQIESRLPLKKPLDLLAQHLITICIGESTSAEDLKKEIIQTFAYAEISDQEWQWVLNFVQFGGNSLKAYPQYHKLKENAQGQLYLTEKRLVQYHRMSIGTISGDSSVSVKFANGQSLGTVEEWFISKLKTGSPFIFAGRTLELVRFRNLTATVKLAKATKRKDVPTWQGGKMPLSTELSIAVAQQFEILSEHNKKEAKISPELTAFAPIFAIQSQWSALPSSEHLLVEHTSTREGEYLFFYPFAGRLVHEGLAALTAFRMGKELNATLVTTQNDYGFSIYSRSGVPLDPELIMASLSSENLLTDLVECMNAAEMARRQFREVARVAGLIIPTMPGRAQPNRNLQTSSSLLYDVFTQYDPENLLLKQAEREILEKQLDLTRLKSTLEELFQKEHKLIETEKLTPMAFPLWADRLSAILPAGDATTRLEKMLLELEAAAG